MKKIVLLLGLVLLTLTACGQKKSHTASSASTSEDKLDTTLPIISNAEKNTVVTKTLVFPKTENGSQQKQVVTYKDEQFLSLSIEQVSPNAEDLKQAIKEYGVEEARAVLNRSLEADEHYQQVKDLPGFSMSLQILNENELKRVTNLDFQTLDVDKAAETEYLKALKLKELLKMNPAQYVENQLLNGAKEE